MKKKYAITHSTDQIKIESFLVFLLDYKKVKINSYNAREGYYFEEDSFEGTRQFECFADAQEAEQYFDSITDRKVANFSRIGAGSQTKAKLIVLCSKIIYNKNVENITEETIPDTILNTLKTNAVKLVQPKNADLKDFYAYCF